MLVIVIVMINTQVRLVKVMKLKDLWIQILTGPVTVPTTNKENTLRNRKRVNLISCFQPYPQIN